MPPAGDMLDKVGKSGTNESAPDTGEVLLDCWDVGIINCNHSCLF
jgi:hypothetical protein